MHLKYCTVVTEKNPCKDAWVAQSVNCVMHVLITREIEPHARNLLKGSLPLALSHLLYTGSLK